ncbi:MAG: hypothetical protein JW700_01315 [Candidatus Aenigmarchaeota archaeon]|nr:hypothetical protein [Candidatus Aenigmarchaeota archaeon]
MAENKKSENKSHNTTHKPKKNVNKWKIISLSLIVLLCVSVFVTVGLGTSGSMSKISSEEASDMAVDYINNNLVQAGTEASFLAIEETGDGLYNVTVYYLENEIPVYVTQDGKYMFLSAPLDLSEDLSTTEETTQPQATEVTPTARPTANAFVMSYCPYGLQFLKAYVPVIELLGDEADLQVNFVHYIMHGEKEVTENTRMYCIQNEQSEKFTDYLRCFVEATDSASCITSVGIDEGMLNTCMEETDELFDITKNIQESESTYPPYLVDADLANQFGVGGSPTFVLNGVTVSVSRSAEAIKQAICSAFIEPPAACDQTLSTVAEQAGAGAIGAGTGSDTGATC